MSKKYIIQSRKGSVLRSNAMIICHCGGDRSALAAETLQKMGYKNVRSMAGGLRAWKVAGLPTTK
jgi:rhodanese-related sulfurtransferase